MRLINRSKNDPVSGEACAAALKAHAEKFGEHGKQYTQTMYTVLIQEKKVTVEVINRRRSYVATAMTGARHIQRLPGNY
ncbi:DUF4060 family protein [Citrobacter sp. ANG330]|uniref:DUF4060 family protein n=1 Tax=Citrobacter sp. ANG330 TaxID=3048142 RepID=UPI0039C0EE29